jgi:hypothetical protein
MPFCGYVGFHFLYAESLEESFVVVALWSYIVLVSDYHGLYPWILKVFYQDSICFE